MSKPTKEQKRQQKVRAKILSRENFQRRQASIMADRVERANKQIMAAVEVAVERAMQQMSIPDLTARALIADVLKDHLFVADPSQPLPQSSTKHPSRQPAQAPKTSGFDRGAFGQGGSAKPVDKPIKSGSRSDATGVLDKPVGFDRGAWGQGNG